MTKISVANVLGYMQDGAIRSREELESKGVSGAMLSRMVKNGLLVRHASGLYQIAGAEPDHREQYAALAKAKPDAVFILFTAATHHGITQVMPGALWVGIPENQRIPRQMQASIGTEISAVRWRRPINFEVGVEKFEALGVTIKVTNPARTVVDMWRYSTLNKVLPPQHARVDEESFLDCFSLFLNSGAGTIAEISRVAADLGVAKGMMPHIKDFGFLAGPGR